MTAFNYLYRSYNWLPIPALSGDAVIDGWGTTVVKMTHASRSYAGTLSPSGMWESKLGYLWRVTHGREDLVGNTYGRVLVSFDEADPAAAEASVDISEPARQELVYSVLARKVESVPASTRETFKRAYAAWEAAWDRGALAISSDTRDRRQLPEFADLLALGVNTIPLVVEKLLGPGGYMALQLYEALQPSPELLIKYTENHPLIFEGEQARATRAAQLWLHSAH